MPPLGLSAIAPSVPNYADSIGVSSRHPPYYHLSTSIDSSEGKDEPEVQPPVDACALPSTPVLRWDTLPDKETQISVPTPASPRQAILPCKKIQTPMPIPTEPRQSSQPRKKASAPVPVPTEPRQSGQPRKNTSAPVPIPTEPRQSGQPRKKTSAPVSVPTEPRRSGHPRKSVSTSAPTSTPFNEHFVEEAGAVTDLSSPVVDEPHTSADHVVHDAPLTAGDLEEINEVAEVIEATNEDHSTTAIHTEQPPTDNPQVFFEQPRGVVEAEEEDEEAPRHRVTAKLVQISAFDPPPPITQPQRLSIDEPAPILFEEPLDVEDEANVNAEQDEENTFTALADPARRATIPSIERDAAEAHLEIDQAGSKLDEHTQVHRDGES